MKKLILCLAILAFCNLQAVEQRQRFPTYNVAKVVTTLSTVCISPRVNGPDIRITSKGSGTRSQLKIWSAKVNDEPCQIWNLAVCGVPPSKWTVTTIVRRLSRHEVEFITNFDSITAIGPIIGFERTQVLCLPDGVPIRYLIVAASPDNRVISQTSQTVEEVIRENDQKIDP